MPGSSLNLREADEVDHEDLVAASAFYDQLILQGGTNVEIYCPRNPKHDRFYGFMDTRVGVLVDSAGDWRQDTSINEDDHFSNILAEPFEVDRITKKHVDKYPIHCLVCLESDDKSLEADTEKTAEEKCTVKIRQPLTAGQISFAQQYPGTCPECQSKNSEKTGDGVDLHDEDEDAKGNVTRTLKAELEAWVSYSCNDCRRTWTVKLSVRGKGMGTKPMKRT